MMEIKGFVPMLGLSRFPYQGGSYRTIQRFFSAEINWPSIKWRWDQSHHLQDKDSVKLLVFDHSTVTKSGKKTIGQGRCIESLYGKAVPGIEFLTFKVDRCEQSYLFSYNDFTV